MRKPFKSYLRHPLDKKPITTGPSGPEIVEVTILPQWDTVLRYDGSPIMIEGNVVDPADGDRDFTVVTGDDQSYRDFDERNEQRDWLAIGLATDNEALDKFRSPNPLDEDAEPDNIVDGVVYTNTGPTRSVLSFDLQDIPAGAIIEEAFLELVPVTNSSTDDVWMEFNDGINNIWPDNGVPCEVLNLIEEISDTCTWNGTNNTFFNSGSDPGPYPVPANRWHRQFAAESVPAEVPPNPIGAMQNSKRWDIQEPEQSFRDQYIGDGVIDEIDPTPGGSELYGHIGYGTMGGGAVENVPEDKELIDDFRISKEAHDEQVDADAELDESSIELFKNIDVLRAVTYAHEEQNRLCNLLVRAKHWGSTNLIEDQTEEIEVFEPDPLRMGQIELEDETDQGDPDSDSEFLDTDVDIEHTAIIRFDPPTFDVDGDPSTPETFTWIQKAAADEWTLEYDWRVKYPDIINFNFNILQNGVRIAGPDDLDEDIEFLQGDILTVDSISSEGGFQNEHIFEFFLMNPTNNQVIRAGGLNTNLVLEADDIPEVGNTVNVMCRVGANAQGVNVGLDQTPSPSIFAQRTLGEIVPIPPVINPPSETFEFDPIVDEETDFESPIDLSAEHTATVKLTLTNIRPEFNWTAPPGLVFSNTPTASIQLTGDTTNTFTLVPEEIQATVDETTGTAVYEWLVRFNGQAVLDALPNSVMGDSFTLSLSHSYLHVGTDQNGDFFTDNFQSENATHTFSIFQEDTTNNFDITNPANRRGVFEFIGLHVLEDSASGIPPNPNATLAHLPTSSVKTPCRQIELAPSQLKCDTGETFTTVLMPVEELSRFHGNLSSSSGWPLGESEWAEGGIRGTKNKFAIIAGGLASGTRDESIIRNEDGSILNVPGSLEANTRLVTSGGIGEKINRQIEDPPGTFTDIMLPSDLAVYYYNRNVQPGEQCEEEECAGIDNTGQDCSYHDSAVRGSDNTGCPTQQDVGWVYYRALSGVGFHANNNGRFRQVGNAARRYEEDDFDDDFNEDDGLGANYVMWEKLSGDPNGVLEVSGNFDGRDPNIGAFVFPLNDRYDFVETPTTEELGDSSKWPVPLSTAFRLTEDTPAPATSDDVRNNPTLLKQFTEGEALSDIIDIIDYKIKSLDNGVGQPPCVFATIDENGIEILPPADPGGLLHNIKPERFHGIQTNDTLGKIIPVETDHSLFVGAPGNGANDNSLDVWEFTQFNGLGFDDSLDVPWSGEALDSGIGSYCNYKSHFWNGKGTDMFLQGDEDDDALDDTFSGDDFDLPTRGPIPLFWRRRDTPYFVHFVNFVGGGSGNVNNTTPLPNPLTSDFDPAADPTFAYHGINIVHGNLHRRLREISEQVENVFDVVITPIVQYVVEVIRGGSVYHRDLYRLSGSQSSNSEERADADFVCKACQSADDITLTCQDALNYDHEDETPEDLADTLYQFGIDGEAWKDDTQAETSWYAPSDWRAGDTIRVYAIAAHIEGDEVIEPNTGEVRTATPTPGIQRIKKYCPIGDPWTPRTSWSNCCNEVDLNQDLNNDGDIGPEPCDPECFITVGVPTENDWGGVSIDDSSTGGGLGGGGGGAAGGGAAGGGGFGFP